MPLFRLAGLEGLTDFDAVVMWAFKAKVFHTFAGRELWPWFHNPALAYGHLDYPLLVPLLHAFTYGAIGHVNEFVTKFWNQWMLLLLAWPSWGPDSSQEKTVADRCGGDRHHSASGDAGLQPPGGATFPMVFFAATSSLQLAMGLAERQPGRVRLGLLLLLATAMVNLKGCCCWLCGSFC